MIIKVLDKIPYLPLTLAALLFGLAPLFPEPHLLEKLRLLAAGKLNRAIDIFDLLMHATPSFLLAIKFFADRFRRNR
jgi:hypothetical protein